MYVDCKLQEDCGRSVIWNHQERLLSGGNWSWTVNVKWTLFIKIVDNQYQKTVEFIKRLQESKQI